MRFVKALSPFLVLLWAVTGQGQDISKVETIVTSDLSQSGKYFAVEYRKVSGETRIEYGPVDSDERKVVENASMPRFAFGGHSLVYRGGAPPFQFGIVRDLDTDSFREVSGANDFLILADSSVFFTTKSGFSHFSELKRLEGVGIVVVNEGLVGVQDREQCTVFGVGSPLAYAIPKDSQLISVSKSAVLTSNGIILKGGRAFNLDNLSQFIEGFTFSGRDLVEEQGSYGFSVRFNQDYGNDLQIWNTLDEGHSPTKSPRQYRGTWNSNTNSYALADNGDWTQSVGYVGNRYYLSEIPDNPQRVLEGAPYPRTIQLIDSETGLHQTVAAQATESPVYGSGRLLVRDKFTWKLLDSATGRLQTFSASSSRSDFPPVITTFDEVIISEAGQIFVLGSSASRITDGDPGYTYKYLSSHAAFKYFQIEESSTGKIGLGVFDGRSFHRMVSDKTISGLKVYPTGVTYLKSGWSSSPEIIFADHSLKPLDILAATPNEYPISAVDELKDATLIRPVSTEKVPLVVYVYEREAGRAYEYSTHDELNPYSIRAFVQSGYAVLLPNLAFETGNPAVSARNKLKSILESVRKQGSVDMNRIAVMGHSWGGYLATYLASTTDWFRCAIAGSPITDLTTLHKLSYNAAGTDNGAILEYGQGRMGLSPKAIPKAYHQNSPLPSIHSMNTPLLVSFGIQDQLVNPVQSELLFHAMREFKKHAVFLKYEKQGHFLTNPELTRDYSRKIKAWLNRFLTGGIVEPWMDKKR